jgi:hypothetical protein
VIEVMLEVEDFWRAGERIILDSNDTQECRCLLLERMGSVVLVPLLTSIVMVLAESTEAGGNQRRRASDNGLIVHLGIGCSCYGARTCRSVGGTARVL